MTKTNPVDPELRKAVCENMGDDADVKLVPTPETVPRPGLIRLEDGTVHMHQSDDFRVVAVSKSETLGRTLVHIQGD